MRDRLTEEIDLTTEIGKDYKIVVNEEILIDHNAGADADGGRGRTEVSIESFKIIGVITSKGDDILERLGIETISKLREYVNKEI